MKKLINSKMDAFQSNRLNNLQMSAIKGGDDQTDDDIVIIDLISE